MFNIFFSSRMEDSSEQVKKELARILGHLSCIQSRLSKLNESRSTHEILCQKLSLASEHGQDTFPSLGASFVKPFLPLLRQQAPSSVKQGILLFCFLSYKLQEASKILNLVRLAVHHFIHLVVNFHFLAFLEAFPHLCQHVNLVGGDNDSRAILCALIGLMEDSDPRVRIYFSQSVRFLLKGYTGKSEQGFLCEVSNFNGCTQQLSFTLSLEV